MLYLKKRDFIYGAILSALISNKYKTVLIDGDSDDRRIYKFTSDNEDDFIAYFKHSMNPKISKKSKNTSWQFVFSDEEISYLTEKVCEDEKIKLFLLCGQKEYRGSEIAIVEQNEIMDTLFETCDGKKSLTVRKEFNSNTYKIPKRGGRDNDLKIPTNRIEQVEAQMQEV